MDKRPLLILCVICVTLLSSCSKKEEPKTAPSVSTKDIEKLDYATFLCSGCVNDDGGADVSFRGVVWSVSPDPTVDLPTKNTQGTGIGEFQCLVNGLNPVTTYYIRTFAVNSIGASYGEQKVITTGATTPEVVTTSVSYVTTSTAECYGEVLKSGGSNVTDRGFVASVEHNPTIESSIKTTADSGLGTFLCSLSELHPELSYYVRAYAVNEAGTGYSEEKLFTTSKPVPEYVDLGLSVKWATFNVGAGRPADYGDYFAWGEVDPYYADGHYLDPSCTSWRDCVTGGNNNPKTSNRGYLWETYSQDGNSVFAEWRSAPFSGTPGTLKTDRDVAPQKWGEGWRMPTEQEWLELFDPANTTWSRDIEIGTIGFRITSTKPGFAGRSIFLPASGKRFSSDLRARFKEGYYWSSTLSSDSTKARYCYLGPTGIYDDDTYRFYGFNVRPVFVK